MTGSVSEIIKESYSIGIALGLIIGKPIGIFLLSLFAVRIGICKLPNDLNWKVIFGVGFLGGIGFTMSIFITLLAFESAELINHAKLIILLSSLLAGILGFLYLKAILKQNYTEE